MDIYYKVKPGSPTWKRVVEFEEKRDRVFEIQKKVLTKLGIATYKHFGGVFYSPNVLPVMFTSEEAKIGWKKVRGENHYQLDTKSPEHKRIKTELETIPTLYKHELSSAMGIEPKMLTPGFAHDHGNMVVCVNFGWIEDLSDFEEILASEFKRVSDNVQ